MSYIGKQPRKAALTSSDIEDGIITAAKIEDGAVVAAEIASNAVTTAKINADAVTGAKIADDAVGTDQIAGDAAISTSGAITTTGAFTSIGIDDNSNALAMTIDSSERIGIGTASPVAPLVVSNGGASGMEFHPELTTNTNRFVNYNRSGSAYNKLKIDALEQQFFISGNEAMKIDAAGHVTQPSQPAVQAKVTSAISNIEAGSLYAVPFATEIFDNNADFNTSNYTFTAPVTGRYVVMLNGTLGGYPLAADYVQWHLATSNRTYNSTIDPDGFDSSPVYHNLNLSALVDMDANDTALAKLHIHGSVDTTDIFSETYFSIYLAC